MKKKKKLMVIIDSNFYAYRAFATRDLRTSKGVPTSVISGMIQMIKNLYSLYSFDRIVLCWDSKGGSKLRKKIFKAYKGNRGEKPEDLKSQLEMAYQFFKKLNVRQVRIKGIEGDDLMGVFVHYFSKHGYKVIIASADKDLWQLVRKGVAIWRPINKQFITLKVLREMFDGLGPKEFLRMKALQGDKGDNIPGIDGIGPKTAQKIIKKYGSIKNILKGCGVDKDATLVRKNEKAVRLAYDLSRIRVKHEELGISDKRFEKIVAGIIRKRKVNVETIHRQVKKFEMKHRNMEALAEAFSVIAI